jgi:hypothetical protein
MSTAEVITWCKPLCGGGGQCAAEVEVCVNLFWVAIDRRFSRMVMMIIAGIVIVMVLKARRPGVGMLMLMANNLCVCVLRQLV